jgi:tetratricopeptide (TPR) repeat protein
VNTVARPNPIELETLIVGSDNSPTAIRNILGKLTASRIFAVTDQPWDGRSFPRSDMRLLFVSDGDNLQQPMLAVFSAAQHAQGSTGGDHAFKNVVEVDATWALMAVPAGAGVIINANTPDLPLFRIGPAVAAELRKYAEQRLQSFINKSTAPTAATETDKVFITETRELLAKGDFPAARVFIEKILAMTPNDNDALQLAGQIAIEERRNSDALNYFTAAVNTAPNRAAKAASMSGLGQALTWLRQYDKAEKTLLQAIELDPRIVGPLRSLAEVKAEKGEIVEAIDLYRRMTAIAPRDTGLLVKIADLLVDSGQTQEALGVYDTAIALDSNNAWLHFNKGVALQVVGRLDDAKTSYEKARELGPDQIGHYRLTALKKYKSADDPEIAVIKEHTKGTEEDSLFTRIDAHFSLFKVYDDLGDYTQAFEHLKIGNELKRSEIQFSLERQHETFAKIIALFTPGFLKRFHERKTSSAKPIFIVGMPRSGTTLLEQMLAGHKEIYGAGELSIMQIISLDIGAVWSERGDHFPGTDAELLEDFARAVGRYDRLTQHLPRGTRRITDKMPQNFVFAGLIDLMFDDYTIINCRRTPMATGFSCYEHIFNNNSMPFSYDLTELAEYYKLYAALMEHWHKVMPGKILDVNYEQVVAEPEAQLRRVLDHCRLEFDPACLDFHTLERPVQTASASQVRQPLYKSAIEKWKRYETQLQPLIEGLGDLAKGWPKTP